MRNKKAISIALSAVMAFTTALGESGCSGTVAVSITFTLPPCKTRKSSDGAQSNSVLQRVAASSGSPDDTEMRKISV